ncbi:sporulation protein YqfD [Ammoniphilus sp. YIM 78166]|uniref:sporulation protein YqfD n=1 Tax=Ammoniphilus sp. YIM 78166 TaxID=1644106 RepID=UPI0014309DE0|nr:sporulation protein YqfD [Ammoniphilus sp. YIM 78166]
MQHQWLKWFNGYLVIILRGRRIERLINLAVQKKMQVWNITRYDDQRGKINIRLEDFFLLKPLLRETGCRMQIMSRHGFPFFLTRVRERYAFFGGFLLFIIMLFLLSNVIWSIEVVGNEKIGKYEVLQVAEKIGIQQGKFSFMMDEPDKIQAKLLENLPEASWVGFQIKGTKAQIRVVEKILPETKEALSPRHLVAKKSAVISTIFAEEGKPVVRPDDFVKKGDILVSGLIGKAESPTAVAARGRVEGEVWYETEVIVPIEQKQAVFVGESHRNFYIVWGEKQIKIWGYKELPFQNYEIKDQKWVMRWGDKSFPLAWKTEDLHAVETQEKLVDEKQAQDMAIQAARQDILSKMGNGGYIKEEKVLHLKRENDKVYIKMHVVAIEDIAVEQPIIIEGE